VQGSHLALVLEPPQPIPVTKSCTTTASRSALRSIEPPIAYVSSCSSAQLDHTVFEGLSNFNKTSSRKSPLRIWLLSSFGSRSYERASPTSNMECH
jgi:hypothetical protein